MTRKEVIDWLCRLRSWIAIYIPRNKQECKQALDIAIRGLKIDEEYQLEYERTINHDPNFVPIILITANGGKVNAFLYKPQCLIVTDYVTVEYSKAIGWSFEEVIPKC